MLQGLRRFTVRRRRWVLAGTLIVTTIRMLATLLVLTRPRAGVRARPSA